MKMGLTERHWFENEEVPENYEWALEDDVYNSRATKKGSEMEMTKLEKVIKALELCTSKIETRTQIPCETCPYHNREYHGIFGDGCCNIQYLHDDILSLLKVHEPRVMKLEEVLENAGKIGFPCWVEDHIEDIGIPFLFPAVVISDDIYVQYTGNVYYEGAIYHRDYNKRLRCWTSRPTDEQRKVTLWN